MSGRRSDLPRSRPLGSKACGGERWVTVVSVIPTDVECGWSVDHTDGTRRNSRYRQVVTTDDGQVREVSGNQIVRRRLLAGEVVLAEYVARADLAVAAAARKIIREREA